MRFVRSTWLIKWSNIHRKTKSLTKRWWFYFIVVVAFFSIFSKLLTFFTFCVWTKILRVRYKLYDRWFWIANNFHAWTINLFFILWNNTAEKAKNAAAIFFQSIGQCGNAKYLLDVELNTLDEDADSVPIFGAYPFPFPAPYEPPPDECGVDALEQ